MPSAIRWIPNYAIANPQYKDTRQGDKETRDKESWFPLQISQQFVKGFLVAEHGSPNLLYAGYIERILTLSGEDSSGSKNLVMKCMPVFSMTRAEATFATLQ